MGSIHGQWGYVFRRDKCKQSIVSILVNAKVGDIRKDCQYASAYDKLFNIASDSVSHIEILSSGFDKAGYVTAMVHQLKYNIISLPMLRVLI